MFTQTVNTFRHKEIHPVNRQNQTHSRAARVVLALCDDDLDAAVRTLTETAPPEASARSGTWRWPWAR